MSGRDARQVPQSSGVGTAPVPEQVRRDTPGGRKTRLRAEACAVLQDHYRELFLSAQQAREQIRGGIGTPVAATAFTVFNLGTVGQHFDATRWQEPTSFALVLLSVAAVLAVLGAVYNVVMVEWHFIHVEPPDLDELLLVHERAGEAAAADGTGSVDSAACEELRKALAGGYYAGYVTLLPGNARSARSRTRALRLVLLALACVAIAFLLLPLHLSGGAS